MNYSALQKAAKLNIERKRRRRRYRIVSMLAAIVVFCTTYALILPAITLEPQYTCGLKEHTHTDECYSLIDCTTLTCPFEIHTHNEACLDENGNIACHKADYIIHTHNSYCYNNDGELICTLKELSEHTHTEVCYEISQDSIIGSEEMKTQENTGEAETEAEAETETETGAEPVLICTRPEICAHTHTADCYDGDGKIICEKTELKAHNHTDACISMGEKKLLTCDLSEHIHDKVLCVTNPTADIEAPEIWEASLPTQYTGKLSADLIAVAKSQIGYKESTVNLSTDVNGKPCGYNRYGAWYGESYGAWNAYFADFCMYYTNEKAFSGLSATSPETLRQLWKQRGLFATPSQYTGALGDLIFIDMNKSNTANFVGIITGFKGAAPVAVFGDWEDGVAEVTIDDTSIIAGYGLTSEVPAEGFKESFFPEGDNQNASQQNNEAVTATENEIEVEVAEDTSHFDKLAENGFYTYWEQFLDDYENEEAVSASGTSAKSSNTGTMMLSMPYMLTSSTSSVTDTQTSDIQIDEYGGHNTSDDGLVDVSKTIAGTELENVFDITLTVDTSTNLEIFKIDPDMSIVIVMDISNTMRTSYGDMSRYEAAVIAAEDFIDKFEANAPEGTNANLGFVAFNTGAHEIFDLQECTSTAQATALKNEMRQDTGTIINASDYADSHQRFTNIEAGLAMGYDMLDSVDSQNKFIIFLSDGFPTTYMKTGTTTYEGYDPFCSSGTVGKDGVFYDSVYGQYCHYGTSYSDKAAIKAHAKADEIKAAGAKIFSIGVDVSGQSLQKYIDQGEGQNFSVVDRTSTTYDIGAPDSSTSFKNWLRNSIGSGYYYDSDSSAELDEAFQNIFDEIKTLQEESTTTIWAAVDPLPIHSDDNKYIEFIHFYDRDGNPADSLSGVYTENGENTVSLIQQGDSESIHWDLKESGYTSTVDGSTTHYSYSVTYRVRIKNEMAGFTENHIYDTNDITRLTYQSVVTTNGKPEYSELRYVDFPIPAVHAFEAEFSFGKIDHNSLPLPDIAFILTHDTEKCSICHGDGTPTPIEPFREETDRDGRISFTDIPSGHIYTLTEEVPEGFRTNGDTYSVSVSYDEIIITVIHTDGSSEIWENNTSVIENIPIFIPDSESLLITKAINTTDGSYPDDIFYSTALFTFRVMATDADGNKNGEFFLLPGTQFSIIRNGETVGTDTIKNDGTFTLKADETAIFPDLITAGNGEYYVVEELIYDTQSDTVSEVSYIVRAEEKTPDSENHQTYTAFTSAAFDKYDTTSVVCRNTLENENFGGFSVTKTVQGTGYGADEDFTMEITIGSLPVPAGTKYTVNGVEETVTEEGRITLKADETAVFSGLYPGTAYTVREIFENTSEQSGALSNVALSKSVTANSGSTNNKRITDGVINTTSYWDGSLAPAYFIIDLGAKYNIDHFKIYNYWKDGRSYDYVIATSLTNSDFTTVCTANSVTATSSGSVLYPSSGEEVTCRYIKVTIPNGNSVNKYCHCVEFEAYGYIPDESTSSVSYSGTVTEGGTVNTGSTGAYGTVPPSGSADIVVTNEKQPFSISFPITKTAENNSGEKSFSFIVEQVSNGSWEHIADTDGTVITVTDNLSSSADIYIGFPAGTSGTFYYKVSEVAGTDSFFYDSNFYIVKVTAYSTYAIISGIYKNGAEEVTLSDISFINSRKSSLYVSKIVDSNDKTGEFSFTAIVTLNGEAVALPAPPEDAGYTVDGNTITFTLSDGEYVFIDNLPYGAKVKVEEAEWEDNAFSVFYRIEGSEDGLITSNSATIPLNEDSESIHFINKAYYEIPETGGIGTHIFTLLGITLVLTAFILAFYKRKRLYA